MGLADILCFLIDDELFVPVAVIAPGYAHVEELGADGKQEIDLATGINVAIGIKEHY